MKDKISDNCKYLKEINQNLHNILRETNAMILEKIVLLKALQVENVMLRSLLFWEGKRN